jgi:hypothetical protein
MKKELLKAFSVYSNGKDLLNPKISGDNLRAINGMRFITMCWVVWGHRYAVDTAVPSVNLSTIGDVSNCVSIKSGRITREEWLSRHCSVVLCS